MRRARGVRRVRRGRLVDVDGEAQELGLYVKLLAVEAVYPIYLFNYGTNARSGDGNASKSNCGTTSKHEQALVVC
jgi:hypothetical protein